MRVYDTIRLLEIRERVSKLHVAEEYNDDLDFLLEIYDDAEVSSEEVKTLRDKCSRLQGEADYWESEATDYEDQAGDLRYELENLRSEIVNFVDSYRNGEVDEECIGRWESNS